MPYGLKCAMSYDLTPYDLENIGELTKNNIDRWVSLHTGDFSSVDDYRADIGDFLQDWENPESELTFNDCMYPEE